MHWNKIFRFTIYGLCTHTHTHILPFSISLSKLETCNVTLFQVDNMCLCTFLVADSIEVSKFEQCQAWSYCQRLSMRCLLNWLELISLDIISHRKRPTSIDHTTADSETINRWWTLCKGKMCWKYWNSSITLPHFIVSFLSLCWQIICCASFHFFIQPSRPLSLIAIHRLLCPAEHSSHSSFVRSWWRRPSIMEKRELRMLFTYSSKCMEGQSPECLWIIFATKFHLKR